MTTQEHQSSGEPWARLTANAEHLRALLPALEKYLPGAVHHELRVTMGQLGAAVRDCAFEQLTQMSQEMERDEALQWRDTQTLDYLDRKEGTAQ